MLGSNAVQLQVAVDERVRRLVAVAVVDNLAKGTAGPTGADGFEEDLFAGL